MNKIFLFIFLIFVATYVKAQDEYDYKQIALGIGAGNEIAYAGTQINKTEIAYFGNVNYYPTPFINFKFQVQAGKLSGSSLLYKNDYNIKNYINNYWAVILEGNVQLGALFDNADNLSFIKNFYAGTGFGVMNNKVVNTKSDNIYITNILVSSTSKTCLIPIKLGYDYNLIKDQYEQPVLKIDLSYTFNYTIGKGIDGYYDKHSNHLKYFYFYSVGLKYTINLSPKPGDKHLIFD